MYESIILITNCINALFAKFISQRELINVNDIVFFRFALGVIFLAFFIRISIFKNTRKYFLCSIFYALSIPLYYSSLINSYVGVTVFLNSSHHFTTLLFSYFLLKTEFKRIYILYFILFFIGSYFLCNISFSEYKFDIYNIYALISGVFYGLSNVFLKKVRTENNAIQINFFQFIFTLLIALPMFSGQMFDKGNTDYFYLFLLGIIGFSATFANVYGIRFVNIKNYVSIRLLGPPILFIASVFLFNESYNLMQIIGIILIFISSYLVLKK